MNRIISSSTLSDKWVKKAVTSFLKEEGDWLTCSLRKVKLVSDKRGPKSPYGFEWLVHTAFSHWLLKQTNVSNLKIGLQCGETRKKYDLDLCLQQQRLIIEITTIKPGGISYVKKDSVGKIYPADCIPYFLVFSYPNESEITPKLEGATEMCAGLAPEGFRFYLYKKI